MSLASTLAKGVKIRDVETGIVKTFKSNTQAAKYLDVSEWTIRKYKKSKYIYKGKYQILASDKSSRFSYFDFK